MNRLRLHSAIALFAFTSTCPVLFAQITPGNLVVVRVGDGVNGLTSASTAVFLDEFTRSGALVQSIPLPTAFSGLDLPLTTSGTATSEGGLTQSVDGRYLLLAGYGVAPGQPSVASTNSSTVPRVVARVALGSGAIDTSTGLADAYSGNNFRSAVSLDGSQFWTGGTGSPAATAGVRYVAALGDTTSTQISTSVTNIRRVDIQNGQLYCVTQSGAFVGVNQVGTGLPSLPGETITLLPGFPDSGSSPYDFWFADASTLYVADDRVNGFGGIQKWTEAGGTWSLQYTLAATSSVGCRGLSGYFDQGQVQLVATTTSNQLVRVTDTGPAAPFTTLAAAAANTALRGVRFVRALPEATFSGTACPTSAGVPTIGTSGVPQIGNPSFTLVAGNAPALTIVLFVLKVGPVAPFGLPVPGAPSCALIYVLPDVLVVAAADALGAANVPFPLPPNVALGGLQLGCQAAPFDFSLLGFDLPIGTSNALQLTIGH